MWHSGDYSKSVAVRGVVSVEERMGHGGSLMTWMAYGPWSLYNWDNKKLALISLWVLSDFSLSVLRLLYECSSCSQIALRPRKMKIDCSRQTWTGRTDEQTLAFLGLLSEPKMRQSAIPGSIYIIDLHEKAKPSTIRTDWKKNLDITVGDKFMVKCELLIKLG